MTLNQEGLPGRVSRDLLQAGNHSEPLQAPKSKYETPRLAVYGDVRDLTLGSTGDFGESGDPGMRGFL